MHILSLELKAFSEEMGTSVDAFRGDPDSEEFLQHIISEQRAKLKLDLKLHGIAVESELEISLMFKNLLALTILYRRPPKIEVKDEIEQYVRKDMLRQDLEKEEAFLQALKEAQMVDNNQHPNSKRPTFYARCYQRLPKKMKNDRNRTSARASASVLSLLSIPTGDVPTPNAQTPASAHSCTEILQEGVLLGCFI